jgi:hypothetical protein
MYYPANNNIVMYWEALNRWLNGYVAVALSTGNSCRDENDELTS